MIEYNLPDCKPLTLKDLANLRSADALSTLDKFEAAIFGESACSMTTDEKLFVLTSKLKSLEIIMPYDVTCDSCQGHTTVSQNIGDSMEVAGASYQDFDITFNDTLYTFKRPEVVPDTAKITGVVDVYNYICVWLTDANMVDKLADYDLNVFIEFANKFFEASSVRVNYKLHTTCCSCGKQIDSACNVTVDDFYTFVKNL